MAAFLCAQPLVARPGLQTQRTLSHKARAQAPRVGRQAVLKPLRATNEGISVEGREDGVRCFINEEGHLVCERLEPGDYVVKAAAPRAASSDQDMSGQVRPDGKITYCYVLENGALVCEGLTPGEYKLRKAEDGDMQGMLEHLSSLKGAEEKA